MKDYHNIFSPCRQNDNPPLRSAAALFFIYFAFFIYAEWVSALLSFGLMHALQVETAVATWCGGIVCCG